MIEGWADPEMRTVLLTVNLKIEEMFKDVTYGLYPRNLKLSSEYVKLETCACQWLQGLQG